ncbi:hypothetical protein PoB_005697200 [Plakobranchus ocellatus]|uniref:Uncharacterized protein n=1 Tax=Plakobranchus ocellatus TaxID=259542 RepID=A0AAV4CGQ9_9GAST|nr:hypothetical protein PoB_005697200 [Plakobranchus ocellatus]
MAQQLSTSASDAVLAWSVLYFIYHVFWYNFFACLGLGVQGAAAALGVVRFAQSRQSGQIYDYHQMATWLTQVVGLPLLAVGFCHKDMPIMMNLNVMAMAAVLVGSRFLAPGMRQLAIECCAGFALLTIILISLKTWNFYGLLATAAYVMAGRVIGSEGKMNVFYRVDILHVVLAMGNVLYTWALEED